MIIAVWPEYGSGLSQKCRADNQSLVHNQFESRVNCSAKCLIQCQRNQLQADVLARPYQGKHLPHPSSSSSSIRYQASS